MVLGLSWLGPFATYDGVVIPNVIKENAERIKRKLRKILEDNNVIILSNEELGESVDWIDGGTNPFAEDQVSVWNCLFCEW